MGVYNTHYILKAMCIRHHFPC
uniref:Uncharacterized protein n=1 Tax=Moniliophthora roreri TaxID=221103 RepID=A0A0W0GEL9_MONRR